jgi:glycosyltransferase involved in cell wall biosynthesis
MKIGIVASRFDLYPYTRNIVGIVPEAEYVRVRDLFGYLSVAARRMSRITRREVMAGSDLNNQFFDLGLNQVDLLHFFNGVSYGATPWVSTFETILPRFQDILIGKQSLKTGSMAYKISRKVSMALEALAGDRCKRIIALSECSAAMQRNLLQDLSAFQGIEKKIVVMHPPQELLVSQYSDKSLNLDGKIRFMLIASSFFRKGGKEIIETFMSLRQKYHYDIELTVISPLRSFDRYAIQEDEGDVQHILKIVQENKEWIHHYPKLPNKEVLAMMVKSHIGLLPTYADSYGYAVLEFQAAGCPVITTNVRALPEINDNQKGWLIEVPKNASGEAIYNTPEGRQAISDAIRAGLEQAVNEMFADRLVIPLKAEKAIQYIKEEHSVQDFAARMKQVYQDALAALPERSSQL